MALHGPDLTGLPWLGKPNHMRRLHQLLLIITMLSVTTSAFSQTPPQGITYQAVARTAAGALLPDSVLDVRIGILANSTGGDLIWEELHNPTTNAFGLFTLVIGQGGPTGNGIVPTFDLIEWGAGDYFLQVEIAPEPGMWELMGISQFLTVPYAFYAAEAGNLKGFTEVDSSNTNECVDLFQFNDQTFELNLAACGQTWNVPLDTLMNADQDWTLNASQTAFYNVDENIGIGVQDPTSTLHVAGSVSNQITTFGGGSVNVNIDDTGYAYVFNVSGGDATASLPSASTCPGRTYVFKVAVTNGALNGLNLITDNAETIDWIDDPFIPADRTFSITSDGTNWWVFSGTIAP